MAKLRIRTTPVQQNSQVDKYLTKDLGILAKKRLKLLRFCMFLFWSSIILNIYLFSR